jgi:hypothetical protein
MSDQTTLEVLEVIDRAHASCAIPTAAEFEEEVAAQLKTLRDSNFGALEFEADDIVRIFGLLNRDVLRKRYANGHLPFLRVEGNKLKATALDVARHLARKSIRNRDLLRAYHAADDLGGPPRG